jgi:hypothetical protein
MKYGNWKLTNEKYIQTEANIWKILQDKKIEK